MKPSNLKIWKLLHLFEYAVNAFRKIIEALICYLQLYTHVQWKRTSLQMRLVVACQKTMQNCIIYIIKDKHTVFAQKFDSSNC